MRKILYSGYYCDRCGKAIEYRREAKEWLPSKTYLTGYARQAGWSVGKKVLYNVPYKVDTASERDCLKC